MASMDYIQKRITGKVKELEKLNKKLERIKKAEAGNWETNNPYYYSESDLKCCLKDIEATEAALAKYQADLEAATEKANSRNVTVILEFLENWKARVKEYYGKGLEAYYQDKAACKAANIKAASLEWGTPEYVEAKKQAESLYKAFHRDCAGEYETKTVFNSRRNREEKVQVKVKEGKYEYLNHYTREATLEAAMARLIQDLDEEANRKYDFIIERTNAIVGQITDASNLRIGAKDDLNGFIIGTKGTAKVQTIGAGGYNIQCYHFRTLINRMK